MLATVFIMALTFSDMHKMMYAKWRKEGLTHEQAIDNVPDKYKESFIKDIKKSFAESHFGIKT